MKRRDVGGLALVAILAGGGCFGRCVNAEIAPPPPPKDCSTDSDCTPGRCQAAMCVEGRCQNRNEPVGTPCDAGPTAFCDDHQDCVSVKCLVDNVKNGLEGGKDCGANCEFRCVNGSDCTVPADCLSGVCFQNICIPATCPDGVKNGAETDVDCGGGVCTPCDNGKTCDGGADCLSKVCVTGRCCAVACEGICRTCDNAGACKLVPDGDNPGSMCPGPGNACDGAGHCKSCANGYWDKDAGESGLDCGGKICPPCAADGGCNTSADCATCACASGSCVAPACANKTQDGCETDVDCGGPWCGATCTYGQKCKVKEDCLSKVCVNGECGEP